MFCVVKINNKDKGWLEYKEINKSLVANVLSATLDCFSSFWNVKKVEISILLTDAYEMHNLNQHFRDKDKATNVLSFPSENREWPWLAALRQKSLRLRDGVMAKKAGLNAILAQHELDGGCIETADFDDYIYLGDIAFGYEVLLQESKDSGFDMRSYFIHLLIHSLLHLIGFDHNTIQDAFIMESYEGLILEKFNIPSPYSENLI